MASHLSPLCPALLIHAFKEWTVHAPLSVTINSSQEMALPNPKKLDRVPETASEV
jgi:hypothetical protein